MTYYFRYMSHTMPHVPVGTYMRPHVPSLPVGRPGPLDTAPPIVPPFGRRPIAHPPALMVLRPRLESAADRPSADPKSPRSPST